MRLDTFRNNEFVRGRSRLVEALWLLIQASIFALPFPGSNLRVTLLRAFGARIGRRVVIKPGAKIKFPWRLSVGDHSWIGEAVWIDNLEHVNIGAHCCVSQAAYLCTGSHDWESSSFRLKSRGITIEDHCWIAARATVGPGAIVRTGAVLALGSVATGELPPWTISAGIPAKVVRARAISRE